MSEAVAVEQPASATPKKGSRKMLIVILLSVVVLGGGSAGAWYFVRSGKAAAKEAPEKARKPAPAETPEEEASAGEEEGREAPERKASGGVFSLPDDSAVRQVIELQPFIVNLTDQEDARYLRLTVSLGIGGEESEAKPSSLFTARVRNALLAVLTTRSSDEVLRPEGKAKLRKDLLRAARAASEEPRVEAIYITEFIIQL